MMFSGILLELSMICTVLAVEINRGIHVEFRYMIVFFKRSIMNFIIAGGMAESNV